MNCINCGKPIHEKKYDRWNYYLHVDGDEFYCKETLPGTPDATCHICGTTTDVHGNICSAAGKPRHRARDK